MVMSCGVLEAMIGIYSLNKFVKVLSLGYHAEPISQLFGSINRFLINIPVCKNGILRGLLTTCHKIIEEMRRFELEFDQ